MGCPEKLLIFFVAIFLLVFPALSAGHTYNKTYSYNRFDDVSDFNLLGNARSNKDALQVTYDSSNPGIPLTNQSGRITYKTPFKLWEKSSRNLTTLASFTSNFDINVLRLNNATPAEGLAFIIAPDVYDPSNSYGQWLGLMNSSTNGSTTNNLVAIEFDTYKQSFDPNDNHVGININSINSVKTTDLSKFEIEIAPVIATNYTVWIDYNGPSRLLEVYMIKQGENKPSDPVINITLDLSQFVNQNSYLGFSASTGEDHQLNCVLRWNLTMEIFPDGKDRDWVKLVVAIVVPVSASLIIVGALIGFYIYRHRVQDDPNILGALKSLPGTPREIRFSELKKATNNFSEKSKLGQGGFGVVYKGILLKENKTVAVKKFSREAMKGKDDFLAELTIINRLRHKHLVRLEGWCYRKGMLLLVYEYMPNGSLDTHLFGSSEVTLSWERRYKIITGVASALHYLHNEYDQKVVHRDLKASNVLLDSDFNARLGDFGLARVLDNEKTSYAELDGIHGTMGYIAPECFHTGKATRESDVFGFGAVVLEVICGRRPRSNESGFLVDWVWSLYREGRVVEAVDGGLNGDFEEEDAKRLLLLGLACSHPNPNERPKTQAIVQIISRSVDPPFVPAFRPPFVWNMGSSNECSSSLDVTGATSQQATSSYYGSVWSPISRGDNTGDFVV